MNMIVKSSDEATTAQSKTKPKRDGGIQPRKQASKSRVVVEMRRKQIIKDILAGKTQQETGINAGFSPKSARSQVAQTLANPIVKDALIAAMEKLGIDDIYLAQQHRALIEGTKVISATIITPGGGSELADAGSLRKDFIEIPDYAAMARGLDMAYRLLGRYKDRTGVELKQPVSIIIRKFCSRGVQDAAGYTDSPVGLS
jgi:hypothetical protein